MSRFCPICDQPRRPLYKWQGYQSFRCRGCGSETLDRFPSAEELRLFYQAISSKKMTDDRRRLERVDHAFEGYLEAYRRAMGTNLPARFLDLGGGVGYWARAAHDRGIEAWLADWAFDALGFAGSRMKLPRRVCLDVGRCSGALRPASFDFVLARHVIEHLVDPRRFLRHVGRTLSPEGLLLIETPNVASNEQLAHPGVTYETFRVLRRSNPSMSLAALIKHALSKSPSGLNPPKHLWGFTAAGLRHLLEEAGFEIVEVHRPVAGHPVYDPLYYELTRREGLQGRGVAVLERTLSSLFWGRGMNLAILARRGPEEGA